MFEKKKFSAVILAGGTSSRMNGVSKQQTLILGVPAAVRSMIAFERCAECEEIVIVSRADECALYDGFARQYGVTKYKKTVEGGSTRQESAFIGQASVSPDADYIAFHDAARCLVKPEDISRVFREARRYKCAAACRPVTDTVKEIGENGKSSTGKPLERARLYAMQTPQIFLADLYRAAAYTAKEDGFLGTDDCSLLEHAGFGCRLVVCDETNMKITYPVDVAVAEAILRTAGEDDRERKMREETT